MSISWVERVRGRHCEPTMRAQPAAVIADGTISVGAIEHGRARAISVELTTDEARDVSALRDARRELGLTTADCRSLNCAIVAGHLNIFPLTLVGEAATSRDAAVVAQVRNRVSYPLSEAVIDYNELPKSVQRAGDNGVNVLVFTAHKPSVERVLNRLVQSGFTPMRLVTPGTALAAIAAPGERKLVLASTRDAISVSVVEARSVLMERIVSWGERRLVDTISDRLDLPSSVATRLIRGDLGDADFIATTRIVREVLGTAYHELVQEATACLGYCTSTLQLSKTTDVCIAGPVAKAPGLAATLRERTGFSVSSAVPVEESGPIDPLVELIADEELMS